MTEAEYWRGQLARANARHVKRLETLLRREFRRLLSELDLKRPQLTYQAGAMRGHQARLIAILASQSQATIHTFGFLALAMLKRDGEKAGEEQAPTRAERIAQTLVSIARTIASGAAADALAERLAQSPRLIEAVELALITHAPEASIETVAAAVLERPAIRVLVLEIQAAPAAPRVVRAIEAATAPPTPPPAPPAAPPPPPTKPPPAPGAGRKPPTRSRFSMLVERTVRDVSPARARRIAATSGQIIADILGDATRERWSLERTAKEIERVLGEEVSRARARVIARTELGGAQNAATLAMAQDREEAGEILEKVWVSIEDHRRRPTHADAHGQVRAIPEPFAVGQGSLMHPGDPAGPKEEVINCFPGETPVIALGELCKVYRRAYEGPLVTIKTKAGHSLRGSPNHPVLTPNGWVALCELARGDDIIGHRFEVGALSAEHKPNRQPLTIAETFELAAKVGATAGASGARHDFHGDGMRGNVDVVTLEWGLGFDRQTASGEQGGEIGLARADMRLASMPCPSGLDVRIFTANAATYCDVGGSDAGLASSGGHLGHAHSVGLAAAAHADASGPQSGVDGFAGDPMLSGERENAGAGPVLFCDQIDSVARENWRGHLYNLETDTGAFLAGFAVAGNCRCAMLIRRRQRSAF